jgi:hypothetical protein
MVTAYRIYFVVYAFSATQRSKEHKNIEIVSRKIKWKYSTKETYNRNNDVPKGTEDKVYSAVVCPLTINVA